MRMNELLTDSQQRKVRKRSYWRNVWLIAHAWGVIALTMTAFVLAPTWIIAAAFYPFALALIGARQLGLAVLMHDAAHGTIHPNRAINDWISDLFFAWPVIARTDSYRRYHLKHHANTQQDDDPDLILSAPFPITKASLRRKIIRDLTGQTGYQQRKAQIIAAMGAPKLGWRARGRLFIEKLGGPLFAQAVILTCLTFAGHPELYLLLWVIPFLTWHQLVTRIRNIAEHAVVPDNDDPLRNTRTTHAGWLARVFIAPYWVNYHIEHHLLMWVPCYRLPRLQKYLAQTGLTKNMEVAHSYREVLQRAASRPDSQDRPGDIIHHTRRKTGSFGEGFAAKT